MQEITAVEIQGIRCHASGIQNRRSNVHADRGLVQAFARWELAGPPHDQRDANSPLVQHSETAGERGVSHQVATVVIVGE